MSENTPDVAAALLEAAAVLPEHFADSADLTVQALTALQATTMSLPGGAVGMQAELKDAGSVGSLVLIATNMVDHSTGELLSREDSKDAWTKAIEAVAGALKEAMPESSIKKSYMTDPFDILDDADESDVVGVFKGETVACLLLAMPATKTGQGAAAALAAQVAEAEAAAEDSEAADVEGEGAEAEGTDAEGAEAPEAEAAEAAEEAPAETPVAEAPAAAAPPAVDPAVAAATAQFDPAMLAALAASGMVPGMAPQAPVEPTAVQQAALAAHQAAIANATPMAFPQLGGLIPGMIDPRRIDLLREVVMGVSVELGRTRLPVQEILSLSPGAIVELDRAAGAPVDVLVNGTLIAHGEVVVVDEEFAVRITEVITPEQQRQVMR